MKLFLLLVFIKAILAQDGQEVTSTTADSNPPPPGDSNEGSSTEEDISKYAEPLSYLIDLSLNPDASRGSTFNGNVNITFKANSETTMIKLHRDVSVSFEAFDVTVNNARPKDVTYDETTKLVTITLNDKILDRSINTLVIDYTGEYSTDSEFGVILGSYKERGSNKKMILTQFHPDYARAAFPCWDEPKFKAEFQLTLSYPDRYRAISNQEADKSDTVRLGVRTSYFKKTDIMAPYLVAFVISNLPSRSISRGRKYTFYGTNGDLRRKSNTAANYAPSLMDFMAEYLNFPMNSTKLTKVDYVGTQYSTYGAMENWGLNTFEETKLFYDYTIDSSDKEMEVVRYISYTTAMNWFGNLINSASWTNVWVTEGPARMYEYLAPSKVADESWEMYTQFVANEILKSLELDATADSKKLSSEAKTREEIAAKYQDELIFSKAPTIISFLKHLVGLDEFQKTMQNYIQTYKYKAVTPKEMLELFGGIAGTTKTVEEIISGYTDQPGYPLLTLAIDESGKVTVTQTRYLSSGEAADPDIKYDVPITFISKSSPNDELQKPKAWLLKEDENKEIYTISGPDDWILLNNRKVGYYRVLYTEDMYKRISNAMASNMENFNVINRMQYVDDIVHLMQSKKIEYEKGFEYLKFLKTETSPYVWEIMFKYYESQIKPQPKEILKLGFTSKLTKLMKAFLSGVNLDTDSRDSPAKNLRRNFAIQYSYEFGNFTFVNDINNLYNRYKRGSNININLRPIVFNIALANSENDEDWLFQFDKLQKTDSQSERKTFIESLAKTQNEGLVDRLTVYVLSLNPEQGDPMEYLKTITNSGSIGKSVFLNVVQSRSRIISRRFGYRWGDILNLAAASVTSADDQTKLNDFVTSKKRMLRLEDDEITKFKAKVEANLKALTDVTKLLKGAFCDD